MLVCELHASVSQGSETLEHAKHKLFVEPSHLRRDIPLIFISNEFP